MENFSSQTKKIIMGQDKKRLQEQVIGILAEVTALPKERVKKQKELKELLCGLNQRYLLIAYVEADMDVRFCKQEEDSLQTLEDLIDLVLQKRAEKS